MTTKTHKWKISIFRKGVGAGLSQSDVSLPKAWKRLLAKAGPAYLTGVNDRGERFGPDLMQELEEAFAKAVKDIRCYTNRHHEILRNYSVASASNALVEIRRL